jgi:SAM-dependent methyltransferase
MQKNHGNNNAKEMYNEHRFGNFNYNEKRLATEPLLRHFLKNIGSKSKLFDIGCGVGFWAKTYLTFGIPKENIELLDLAPDNASALKEQGFNATQGSVLSLPFADNIADYVICNGVIHHTNNSKLAFQELVRITKPGGKIYLNVYNAYNPYFYIVHKATWPFRYLYWHGFKQIADILYFSSSIVFQPLSYLLMGKFLDKQTGRTLFMDQVMTPNAELFTKSEIRRLAKNHFCSVKQIQFNKHYFMIASIIEVNKPPRI